MNEYIEIDPVSGERILDPLEALRELEPGCHLEAVEDGLRVMAERLTGRDALAKEMLREQALGLLGDLGLCRPAALLTAALGPGSGAAPGRADESPGGGQTVELEDPEPWPESVVGAKVLDEVADLLDLRVEMRPEQRDAVALWTVFSYSIDCFDHSPRLAISSATKRCGKTLLLETLARLVRRPLPASNISPAGLFRAIERFSPSILLDEADSFFGRNDELRGLINSGHGRGSAFVIRVEGEGREPRVFSTWCPIAIALIGNLPATIEDRSIPILLQRKPTGQGPGRMRGREIERLAEPIRRKLTRWVADNEGRFATSELDAPRCLNDRQADSWLPLLAIGSVAGGSWEARAMRAAEALGADRDEGDSTPRVQMLADLMSIFDSGGTGRLSTAELLGELHAMEDRDWSEWGQKEKPITGRGVARLLRPFGIQPKNLRTAAGRVPKGYRREDVEPVARRYFPVLSATSATSLKHKDLGQSLSATSGGDVADRNCRKSLCGADVADVADRHQGEPEAASLNCELSATSGAGTLPRCAPEPASPAAAAAREARAYQTARAERARRLGLPGDLAGGDNGAGVGGGEP